MDIISLPESHKNDSNIRNSNKKFCLHELPTDVLLHIFKFSDLSTLFSLSCCCKRFYNIISDDSVWRTRSKVAVMTNQSSEDVIIRSSKFLNAKQKCRISVNWKLGSYVEKCFSTRIKFMPTLILEKNRLWMSKGENIHVFRRQGSFIHWKNPLFVLSNGHCKDICHFVKIGSLLLSGGRDGKICAWSEDTGHILFNKNCHGVSDVRSIDASNDIVVSGSRDSLLKVWRLKRTSLSEEPIAIYNVVNALWSLAIDPTTKNVCCGTTGLFIQESIKLLNLENGTVTSFPVKKGIAIFDIKWESPSTFLTCGYDSMLRLWDTRTNECVCSWMDPFDAAGYCLASDKCHSVLCGTAHNGRVQLWDIRMRLSVQGMAERYTEGFAIWCHL
ncbi:F-box/WD repeat-containing protein 4 isoform X2 [Lycorma delicatula]|uniref:F-box/WD repeat-containing protein 4 isoform X2 n=1 Tax=Lycorma delicatula TaxID=130591 RepID=UPI003F511952